MNALRAPFRFAFALLLAGGLFALPANAQRRHDPRDGDDERPRRAPADTTRLLPRWLDAGFELGPGWMQSPKVIRTRYGPSLAAGLSLCARPAHSFAISTNVEYMNLSPQDASYNGFYDAGGVAPGIVLTGGGNGHLLDATLTVSVRVIGSWWLDAGGGGGHFGSGYPNETFVDIVSGQTVNVPGKSSYGGAVTAGSHIEFQPAPKQRFYAGADWTAFDAKGTTLDFLRLRLGYWLP